MSLLAVLAVVHRGSTASSLAGGRIRGVCCGNDTLLVPIMPFKACVTGRGERMRLDRSEVLVIGGGIAGIATALDLLDANKSVLLLDPS